MKLIKLKLDDLGKIGRGKSKHRPRDDKSLYGGKFPFVQTGDVKAANFYLNEYTQTYNEKGLAQSKLWKKGTLLVTIAANIGDTAILGLDACFPDSIVGFQSYENVSDIRYVKYYLDYIKLELKAISAGTTQDNMSLEKLLSRNLYVHEYTNQVKIASILFSYDELIENNKQRIKLLEEIAEEIYKEWFVRLRFSGYENTKIVDDFPEGWVNGAIGDLVEFKKGKNITFDTVSEGNIPVVAGGLTPAYYHNVANTISPTITISASGANAGFVNLYYEDIWASDCSFLDSKSTDTLFFFYLTLKTRQNEVFFLQKGSAQPHVYPKDIMTLKMKMPSSDLIEKFEDLVVTFFEEIKVLTKKIQLLQETRELLLPRLIGGKLSVEHLLEEKEDLLMVAEPRAEYTKS